MHLMGCFCDKQARGKGGRGYVVSSNTHTRTRTHALTHTHTHTRARTRTRVNIPSALPLHKEGGLLQGPLSWRHPRWRAIQEILNASVL